MTGYEIYIFVLCLVVFVALTAFFATMITVYAKMQIKLIRGGLADDEIKKAQAKGAKRKAAYWAEKIVSALFLVCAIVVFALSLSVKINENKPIEHTVVKVVKSQSMAKKDETNKYLFENKLDNQIQMFDLIKVAPLPKESELKRFDIVVYEVDGKMVVHRIVDIKEPDATHSERRFVLQGDANRYSDKFPVLYSQMRGIYQGEKVPYIGSFVVFMNSPAGYLCIILFVCAVAAYPLTERKLKKESALRMAAINGELQSEKEQSDAVTSAVNESAQDIENDDSGTQTLNFEKPKTQTLCEKYAELSDEQKRFYDEIVAHAAAIEGSRKIANDRFEEYKSGSGRLVRVLIKRGIVTCEYLMPNDNFKRYVAGNKVRVKSAPITLKITDEKAMQAAKDSVDIANKIIEDEKSYKKEQAKLRRQNRKNTGERSEND